MMGRKNMNYGCQTIFKPLKSRGLKGNRNAKLAATPHWRSTVLVKQVTRRFHPKLGELEKQFTNNFRSTYTRPASIEEVKACV
jgi:hypothetical protein